MVIEIWTKRGILLEYKSKFYCALCLPKKRKSQHFVIHTKWQDGLKIDCESCSKAIS